MPHSQYQHPRFQLKTPSRLFQKVVWVGAGVLFVMEVLPKKTCTELDSQPGSPGPVGSELGTYNSGRAVGLVAGVYGKLPSAIHVITDLIAPNPPMGISVVSTSTTGHAGLYFPSRPGGSWDSH